MTRPKVATRYSNNWCYTYHRSYGHPQVPFIIVYSNKLKGVHAQVIGCPFFPSLSAMFMLDPEYPLTFTGRMANTLYGMMTILSYEWITLPKSVR